MRVRINPIACDAHGLCAELAPELFAVDEWGYPVLLIDPLPRALSSLTRRAADACPTLAIIVDERD